MRPIQRVISVGFAIAAIAAAMLPAVEARPVLVPLLAAWDSAPEGGSARP